MKILVTGGAGFVGSNLTKKLLEEDSLNKLIIIDELSSGRRENIPNSNKIEFIEGDVSNKNLTKKIFNHKYFDYIFHLAAIPSIKESILNPIKTHKINFDATLDLLELTKKQKNIKRFIFSSSAAVYGNNPTLPCKEENYVNPISSYGVDKYASEKYMICYSNVFNIPITVFRFFNIFGVKPDIKLGYSDVISLFANTFFYENEPKITIYGDGIQTRDFIHIKDIVTILLSVMNNESTKGKILNACSGTEISIMEIITLLERITGKKAKIIYKDTRDGDIKMSYGDNSKIRDMGIILNFIGVYDGLKEILHYLKENSHNNGEMINE